MRLEIVTRFVVALDDEIAQSLEPAGLFTRLEPIDFVDGAGGDRSVAADAGDVVAYDTVAVEYLKEPTATIESRIGVVAEEQEGGDEPILLTATGVQDPRIVPSVVFPRTPTPPRRPTVRALTADEVDFLIECLPETDRSPEEHCSHPGHEACACWIREQLAAGNEWAWCTVRVAARWQGFQADELLGSSSYASEEQFRRPGGCFDEMKSRVLDRLNAAVAAADRRLALLRDDFPSIGSKPL